MHKLVLINPRFLSPTYCNKIPQNLSTWPLTFQTHYVFFALQKNESQIRSRYLQSSFINSPEAEKEALIRNLNKGRKQKREQKKENKKWRGRVPRRHVHAPRIRANGPWRARAPATARPAPCASHDTRSPLFSYLPILTAHAYLLPTWTLFPQTYAYITLFFLHCTNLCIKLNSAIRNHPSRRCAEALPPETVHIPARNRTRCTQSRLAA